MVERVGPKDVDIVIKFGGGLHTRAPEDEIGDREAADGVNFDLDAENSDLRPRPPFDLLGTAPNAGSIRGGGSFRKADGTVKAFFQAGNTVYDWDGDSFTASPVLDTVNANAKLRGHWRSHSWDLDALLIVTDLALLEPVMEWNGGTGASDWIDVAFRSSPSTAFGSAVHAKYASVSDERLFLYNIKNGSTNLPHMIVGSQRSDYEEISVSNRPASSLGEADPFFLLTPDLRSINGAVEALGARVVSTNHGRAFNIEGASAKDFAIKEFYPGSAASGDESLAYIGNDIIYGRQGRIESVRDTDRFGDTEADDLTKAVLDQVKGFTSWTTVYNSRLNRVYLFPGNGSEVWVFDTVTRDGEQSPWMRWRTSHPLAFQPTFVMSMLDPLDGLEYVFMGDASGNVYRLEGTGSFGDGASAATAQIPRASGSNIGDLTGGGNLAASFDGTTSQAEAACSTKASATSGYIGKTLATSKRISSVKVYGSNNSGYISGANPTVTLDLYAKQGTAPANATDGTIIGTLAPFTDTANESTAKTITSNEQGIEYDHVWVRLSHNGSAATVAVAEFEIFEVSTQPIATEWLSKLISLPLNARVYEVEGYIKYRKGDAIDVSITLEYAGEKIYDAPIVVSVPESPGAGYYNGDSYYGGGAYYGVAFRDRLVRQRIEIPGGDSNEFQVRVQVESVSMFDINEIGLMFRAAK